MESADLGAQWNINPEAGWTGKLFVALKYILFIKGRKSEILITKGKGVFRCSTPYRLWGWRCATNITGRCRLAIWTMSTNNIVKRFLSPLRCDRNDRREESHSLIIWANRCHLWSICEHTIQHIQHLRRCGITETLHPPVPSAAIHIEVLRT